jgi:hypothetical protein
MNFCGHHNVQEPSKEALNREFARGTALSVELAIKDPKTPRLKTKEISNVERQGQACQTIH